MGERNHAVKPEVGYFVYQFAFVAACVYVLGCHDGFGGFFADFFQESIRAFVQQTGYVAGFGIAAACWQAAFNGVGQLRECVC